MAYRFFGAALLARTVALASDAWYELRLRWYTSNKWPWAIAAGLGAVLGAIALVLHALAAGEDERRNLLCLARNVYFEARGEPVAGQYAVAEVTLNRWASGRFADSICKVVYQHGWDPRAGRYIGAFSWTELVDAPLPEGEDWQRAMKIAEAVYFRRAPPVLEGALFYHAVYVKPYWARGKQPIARIGKHVFYK